MESGVDNQSKRPDMEGNDILDTPIDEIPLSVRAHHVLKTNKLKTVKAVLEFGLNNLFNLRNAGKKTVREISDAIKPFIQEYSSLKLCKETPTAEAQTRVDNWSTKEISFIDAINTILTSITPKHLSIIELRYGYSDGKCRTLEGIGNMFGRTRERVRQIKEREIKKIRHYKRSSQVLIENIERLLLQYNGIISIKDMVGDGYFTSGTENQLIFLINLFEDLYKERYRIIFKTYLTYLNDEEIENLHNKIREALLKCRFPLDEKTFLKNIISSIGSISEDYLTYHLLHNKRILISNGKVLSPGRLSISQRVRRIIMRDIDRPLHYSEITKLYRNHFSDVITGYSDIEHAVHSRIGDSKDFIIVDKGTFMLIEKFKVAENIEEIVKVSREILKKLGNISDTRYLIKEIKKGG
ncbi:MAG: hypothetical protein HZA08_09505 [Nitrospirae bacterium]|nr:hypothetical protein [Nitrospirota bacterium]